MNKPPEFECFLMTEENKSEVRLWLLERYKDKNVNIDIHSNGLYFYKNVSEEEVSERSDIVVGSYIIWHNIAHTVYTQEEFARLYLVTSEVV
jgi:hypothetical protein